MSTISLSNINWLTSPNLGSWPIIFIWGLMLMAGIIYVRQQPNKVLGLIILAWLPWALWAFKINFADSLLFSTKIDDRLVLSFCNLSKQVSEDKFCELGLLIARARLLASGKLMTLQIDSGFKPYAYYYLADKFIFTRDSAKADYLLVQSSVNNQFGSLELFKIGDFSIWQTKL